ncbi:hypothetical protein DRP53_06755 [candidate division WOR-3 bacterium]|uniref:Pyrrolo-quinoline quinone repeat domain-containing protein n=1 Tax=candidate division WOR-3 bacterium TaxID=2052148 RepID=A0A660SH40_UNCW3|nr:MAG: hypothetical protein DRP53_06755 [candidate division WOR-3 bacterium]
MSNWKIAMILVIAVTSPIFAQDPVWVRIYDGPAGGFDRAYALAIDNSGNVCVTGTSEGLGLDHDFATIKYDSLGNEVWIARWNGPGPDNLGDRAYDIGIDGSGNVYVVGETGDGGIDQRIALVKYDRDGNELWSKIYDATEGVGEALAVDGIGNVYITGEIYDPSTTYYDLITMKYDTDGNLIWATRSGTEFYDCGHDIVVDRSGNVYVTGQAGGAPSSDNDYITIKYDSLGNEVWVRFYDGPIQGHDLAMAIALDESGNVYVTGGSPGPGTGCDYATIKYDNNGQELWIARYNSSGNGLDDAKAIVVDDLGNVYVTGYGGATVKYDADGNQLYTSEIDDGWFLAMTIDSSGYIYITGSIGADFATVKYDSTLKENWTATYNGPANSTDRAFDIAVDAAGYVYITGIADWSGWSANYTTIKYSQEIGIKEETVGAPKHEKLIVLQNPVREEIDLLIRSKGHRVTIKLFDTTGRIISKLWEGYLPYGQNRLSLKAPVKSGIYFLILEDGEERTAEKIIFLPR